MKQIEFSLRAASRANEAITDNRYIWMHTMRTSTNTHVFEEELMDDLIAQLEAWGIEESEYSITEWN